MENLLQDIFYAVRTLRKSPGFLAVAVLTLALGIGANIALFGVVNAVLLRPLPFPEPDRLVRVLADFKGSGAEDVPFSVPEFEDLSDPGGAFEQTTVVFPASAALSGGDHTERIEMLGANVSYFGLRGPRRNWAASTGRGTPSPGSVNAP